MLSAQTPPSLIGSGAGPQYGITLDSPKVYIGSLVPSAQKHPYPDIPAAAPIPATLSLPLLAWMDSVTTAIIAVNGQLSIAHAGIAAGLSAGGAGPAAPGIASANAALSLSTSALRAALAGAKIAVPSKLVDLGG